MYTHIDGLNIYYQKTGKGTDLIFLHGWGQDVSSFWPLVNLLRDNFTLWMIDFPGHGRSDIPKNAWTVSDYADLIEKFIKQQRLKRVSIIGHSLGGRVGIKIASRDNKVLDKLILEASAGIRPKKSFFSLLFYILVKINRYLIPNLFNWKQKIRHQVYQVLKSDYGKSGELRETFLNIINEDLKPDLKKIKIETLIIWGENDNLMPLKYGKNMYHLIEKSKLVVFEEVGHFPHLENTERFAYYVKDFA